MLFVSKIVNENIQVFNKMIARAQKLRSNSMGMNMNERRVKILDKFIKHMHIKRLKAIQAQLQNNEQPSLAQTLRRIQPLLRFAPMLISRRLFKNSPGGVLLLPYIEKLSNDNSMLSKLIVFVCSIGLQQEERGKGFVGKYVVGFVFNKIFYKIFSPLIVGPQPELGMLEKIELDRQIAANKTKKENEKEERPKIDLDNNEDLKQEFGEHITELSEIE